MPFDLLDSMNSWNISDLLGKCSGQTLSLELQDDSEHSYELRSLSLLYDGPSQLWSVFLSLENGLNPMLHKYSMSSTNTLKQPIIRTILVVWNRHFSILRRNLRKTRSNRIEILWIGCCNCQMFLGFWMDKWERICMQKLSINSKLTSNKRIEWPISICLIS